MFKSQVLKSQQRGGIKLDQAGNGYWYITWSEQVAAGKWRSKRRSTGMKEREKAERVLASFILESGRKKTSSQGDMSVSDVLSDYWNEHACKCESAERMRIAIRHLQHFFGDVLVSAIDRDLVGEYCVSRNIERMIPSREGQAPRKVRGVTDGTLRRELNILVAAINHAVRERRLDRNLVPHIALPDPSPAKDVWLTREQAALLISAASPRIKLFIHLALGTASRKAALEKLTWFQVDLERRLIQLNPPGAKATNKRRPTVPISDALYPILVAAKREAKTEYVLGHAGDVRSGFENAVAMAGLEPPKSWEVDGRAPTKAERRAYLRAKVTCHTLRHTKATWMAQDGVEMWKIAAILGDSLQTVVKNYLHWSPEHLRDAVNHGHVERSEGQCGFDSRSPAEAW